MGTKGKCMKDTKNGIFCKPKKKIKVTSPCYHFKNVATSQLVLRPAFDS